MDLNWDLAPEGATTLVVDGSKDIYWAKDDCFWSGHRGTWEWDLCKDENVVLATRPQEREECEKARAEKLEEWTHVDVNGEKCRIIHVHEDMAWVRYKGLTNDEFWHASALKPIKPQITKAEAWDMLMENPLNSSEVNTIKNKYEVIDESSEVQS